MAPRANKVAAVTIGPGTIIYVDGRAVRPGQTVSIDAVWAASLIKKGHAVAAAA